MRIAALFLAGVLIGALISAAFAVPSMLREFLEVEDEEDATDT